MAIRQYIGARYVPKFSEHNGGDWDNSYTYEAFEIVKYGNDYYTAKKPVPTGVAITNTEYWALTGNYNGAISRIDGEIADINDDITTIQTQLADVDVKTKKSIKDKRICIVGDSYGDESTEYPNIIKSANLFKAVDIVCGGGWGFTGKDGAPSGTTGEGLRWVTHFREYVNSLTDAAKEELTDVYIVGGFNDHYADSNTIKTYMQYFFEYARTALPHVNYHLVLCAWAAPGTINTPNESVTGAYCRLKIVNDVMSAYRTAGDYGCEYCGDLITVLHNYGTDFDGSLYHPSNVGQAKIASALMDIILGSNKYNIPLSSACTWLMSGVASNPFNYIISDGFVQIYSSNNIQIVAPTASTYTAPYYDTDLSSIISISGAGANSPIAGRQGSNRLFIPVYMNNGSQSKRGIGYLYINADEHVHLITDYPIASGDTITTRVINNNMPIYES